MYHRQPIFAVPAIGAQDITNVILHPSILPRLQHLSQCVLGSHHVKWLLGRFRVQYAPN